MVEKQLAAIRQVVADATVGLPLDGAAHPLKRSDHRIKHSEISACAGIFAVAIVREAEHHIGAWHEIAHHGAEPLVAHHAAVGIGVEHHLFLRRFDADGEREFLAREGASLLRCEGHTQIVEMWEQVAQ